MNYKKAFSIVSVALTGLFLLVLSAPVLLAHDEHGWGRSSAFDQGQSIGYQYGFEHGWSDRYAGAGFDLNSREYRRAMAGYDLRFGSRREYQQGFRLGYEAGYNAGFYERRGGYQGDSRYRGGRDWRHRGEFRE